MAECLCSDDQQTPFSQATKTPLKQLIYIGCEGASEAGYAALLQELVSKANQPFYLEIDDLGRSAGDPCARVETAIRRIAQESQNRNPPIARFILLDTDQLALSPQRAETARRLAAENNITIVWQDPCFEALLLRHLAGRTAHRPHNTQRALEALRREWPDYEKGMSRACLANRIDGDAVVRAATVEPDLHTLL